MVLALSHWKKVPRHCKLLSSPLFQGREGAEIEPWEDADYLVYKVTDRFGFLQ
jgi:hypothetical protein